MTTEPTAPPPATAPPGNPPPAPARGRFELVVGASAIMLSVVSLFVAISANRTQERMLAASIWPSLLFSTSNAAPDGSPQIGIDLLNRGTGPARVRWLEMYYRDALLADWHDLLRRCCLSSPEEVDEVPGFTSGVQNRVLGADEWVQMLQIQREGTPDAIWNALDQERQNIRMRACYCSVLDDCWLFDSDREDPEPVSRCPAPGPVLWRG